MELAFETVGLRRVCESDTEARKCLPEGTVEELQARLADIRAATSVSDLVAGKPSLDARTPGRIRFGLDGGYELVCIGNHPKPPLTDGGLVDFSRMRRVRVVVIAQEPENG
jgi:toxin HigB-1